MGSKSKTTTIPQNAEMSPQLQSLYDQFTNLASTAIGGYTGSLNGNNSGSSNGYISGAGILNADGSTTPFSNNIIGADGIRYANSGGANGSGQATLQNAQPWDNDTYMGLLYNDAANKYGNASSLYDDLLGRNTGYYNSIEDLLGQASTAGQPWYDQAWNTYGDAGNYISQGASALNAGRETNAYYDNSARTDLEAARGILDSGQIPQAAQDAILSALSNSVDSTVGSSINNLGGRGVLNSSVTSSALGSIGDAAANAFNNNYLGALDTFIGGYQNNAATAGSVGAQLANSYLDYNNAYNNAANTAINLGNSYGSTGSQLTNDLLNTASGYGNLANLNIADRTSLLNEMGQYFSNANSPLEGAYSIFQSLLDNYAKTSGNDTVIQQSGGCFLTTAVCEFFDLPDDCDELETLRAYRDGWLSDQEDGPELIAEYYRTAPALVDALREREDRAEVYDELKRNFIDPCIELIELEQFEDCKVKYIEMMNHVSKLVAEVA